jgi:hypothetical protein
MLKVTQKLHTRNKLSQVLDFIEYFSCVSIEWEVTSFKASLSQITATNNAMIKQWQLWWIVKQMLSSIFLTKKTHIKQRSNQCPWKYKQCHGKLA